MKKVFELWKKHSYVLLLAFVVVSLFDFRIGTTAIVCMLVPVIVSIFRGGFGVVTYVQGEAFMTM